MKQIYVQTLLLLLFNKNEYKKSIMIKNGTIIQFSFTTLLLPFHSLDQCLQVLQEFLSLVVIEEMYHLFFSFYQLLVL